MRDNKAFTLIELLVVILIIGILVLLATPRFLNYMDMAKLTQIKHDTKVAENLAIAHMTKFNGELPSWAKDPIEKNKIKEYIKDGKLYTVMGKIREDGSYKALNSRVDSNNIVDPDLDIKDDFYILPNRVKKSEVRSRLRGTFLINKEGKGVYIEDALEVKDKEEVVDEKDSIYEFMVNKDGESASVLGFKKKYALKREYLEEENSYHKDGQREGSISLTGDYRIPEKVKIEEKIYIVNSIGDMENVVYIDERDEYIDPEEAVPSYSEYNFYSKEAFAVGTFYGQEIVAIEIPRSITSMGLGVFANNKLSDLKYYGDKDREKIMENFGMDYGEGIFAYNKLLDFEAANEFLEQIFNEFGSIDDLSSFSLRFHLPGYTFYKCGLNSFSFKDLSQYEDAIYSEADIQFSIGVASLAFNNIKGNLIIPTQISNVPAIAFYSNKINKLIISERYDHYSNLYLSDKAFANNEVEKIEIIYGDVILELEFGDDVFKGNPIEEQ